MRMFITRMVLVAILLGSGLNLDAAAIRLTPSSSLVEVGSNFTVDVVAEDINLGAVLQTAFRPV